MARLNPGDVVPGVSILAGAEEPGVFEVVGPLQRCLKDGRDYFLYFHNGHTGLVPDHNFSGPINCPSDANQTWPQVVPYNGGWISKTTYYPVISPDNCPTGSYPGPADSIHDQPPAVERITCFDSAGDILWEQEYAPDDLGSSPTPPGTPSPLTGFLQYQDVYFVTGNESSRVLSCILNENYLGAIGVGGSNRWEDRYDWVEFDSAGNITSRVEAFRITYDDVSSTVNTVFRPAWATNKTYLSGSGYIVMGGLEQKDGVLCLTSDLDYVAQIGYDGTGSTVVPAGNTHRGRFCMPGNLDDPRVCIRLVYGPSSGSTSDRTFEVWAIDFDGVSAPSISLLDTYSATGIGNNWMPAVDGYTAITSWSEGDVVKSPEYWTRFDGTTVLRPNPENVETVWTTFDSGDGDAFTDTHVGVMATVVTDWAPSTPTGGFTHDGDSPYNGDRWGEIAAAYRFSFVDWETGTGGTLDIGLQPPQEPEKTFTGPPSYLGYGDYDMDDAPVSITNPHTNRAFIWHRLYWSVQQKYLAGQTGEDYGQAFFDSYLVVKIGSTEPPPIIPPTLPTAGAFDLLDGSRVTHFRIDLLDNDEHLIGELRNVEAAGGYLEWHAYASVKAGGKIVVSDIVSERVSGGIDWPSVRIRPWILVGGVNSAEAPLEFPLGVYLPSAPAEAWTALGRGWDIELADKCAILDTDIPVDATNNPYTYAAPKGTNVVDHVVALIQGAGETTPAIEPNAKTLSQDMTWPIGTTRLRIINDILSAADFFSLACDGFGQFRLREYVEPADRPPAYSVNTPFSKGDFSLMSSEWHRDRDIYEVPNRYVAVSQGTEDEEAFVAVATNVDPESEFSYPRRGRWITRTVTDTDAIDMAALQSRANRGLAQASAITSGIKLAHAFLPDVQVNRTVRFTNPDADLDILCIVTATTVPFDALALCDSEFREVIGGVPEDISEEEEEEA